MERSTKMGKFVEQKNRLEVPTVENPRSFDRLEKALTGQRDADLLIMSNLDDKALLSFCLANRSANLLCRNESFWRNRFINKYGLPSFNVTNWRRIYLKSLEYLNKGGTDEEVLYNLVKNKEYEFINLIFFLDNFQNLEKKLSNSSVLLGIKGAVEVNDQEMVKFLVKTRNFSKFGLSDMLQFAVKAANKELIDFFIANGSKNLEVALYAAIRFNNLDIVKYILGKFPAHYITIPFLQDMLFYAYKDVETEITDYFVDLIENHKDRIVLRRIDRLRKK